MRMQNFIVFRSSYKENMDFIFITNSLDLIYSWMYIISQFRNRITVLEYMILSNNPKLAMTSPRNRGVQ